MKDNKIYQATEAGPKRWVSCSLLEAGLFVDMNHVRSCCTNLETGLIPILANYVDGQLPPLSEIVKIKEKQISATRAGSPPKECTNCPSLVEAAWETDRAYLFNDVNLTHFSQCNIDCIYCRTNSETVCTPRTAKNAPQLFRFFAEALREGYLSPNAIIRFGGGEPALLPEFDRLVRLFAGFKRQLWLATNAGFWSETIAHALGTGQVHSLVISIDAGTFDTYTRIKRRALFDKVWENVKKYAAIAPERIVLKYIIMEENAHEVTQFVQMAKKYGVVRIAFDLDANLHYTSENILSAKILKAIGELTLEAEKQRMILDQFGGGAGAWITEDGDERLAEVLNKLRAGEDVRTTPPELPKTDKTISLCFKDNPTDTTSTIEQLGKELTGQIGPQVTFTAPSPATEAKRIVSLRFMAKSTGPTDILARISDGNEILEAYFDLHKSLYLKKRGSVIKAGITPIAEGWSECWLLFQPQSSQLQCTLKIDTSRTENENSMASIAEVAVFQGESAYEHLHFSSTADWVTHLARIHQERSELPVPSL